MKICKCFDCYYGYFGKEVGSHYGSCRRVLPRVSHTGRA